MPIAKGGVANRKLQANDVIQQPVKTETPEYQDSVLETPLITEPPQASTTRSSPPLSQGKKNRKRVEPYHFTEDQENDLAEWYRDNDCLYNKRLRLYRDTTMKRQMFEDKAAHLDPPCSFDQLKSFLDGMRTQYGRISKKMSGQAAHPPMTERDEWIVQAFGFLDSHIVHRPSRTNAEFPGPLNVPDQTYCDDSDDDAHTSVSGGPSEVPVSNDSSVETPWRRYGKGKCRRATAQEKLKQTTEEDALIAKISLDFDVNKTNEKTELFLKQDSRKMLDLLTALLAKLQVAISSVKECLGEVKMEVTEMSCIENNTLSHGTGSVTDVGKRVDTSVKQSRNRIVDPSLVQIRADKAEMERRISAFIERKQKEVDDTNVREFCGLLHPNSEGWSCARTEAVFIPRSNSKSHVKVSKVENLYGPQTRLFNTSHQVDTGSTPGVKQEVGDGANNKMVAIEERLRNMEDHIQMDAESKDVFKRIKALEERILWLESLSPEYFVASSRKNSRGPTDKVKRKRQFKHHLQDMDTSKIDDKIQQLKAKILAKKVKQEPG